MLKTIHLKMEGEMATTAVVCTGFHLMTTISRYYFTVIALDFFKLSVAPRWFSSHLVTQDTLKIRTAVVHKPLQWRGCIYCFPKWGRLIRNLLDLKVLRNVASFVVHLSLHLGHHPSREARVHGKHGYYRQADSSCSAHETCSVKTTPCMIISIHTVHLQQQNIIAVNQPGSYGQKSQLVVVTRPSSVTWECMWKYVTGNR